MTFRFLFIVIFSFVISACSDSTAELDESYGPAKVRDRIVAADTPLAAIFLDEVKPVLENRCVVCHGCYDAPCQLKLSSPEGIDRGFSPEVVYATRFSEVEPTRVFVDAKNTQEWRDKKYPFKPVLNERSQTPMANLNGSVLYQLLELKKAHPLPTTDVLPDDFDFSLTRSQSCPSIETLDDYKEDSLLAGMPYGLPAIENSEFKVLKEWIRQGSPMAQPKELSDAIKIRVAKWEKRLNGSDNKSILVGRYIYEHLFLGHLYFSEEKVSANELPIYFNLVRSRSAPGQPIDEIASRRPYQDPKADKVYYRLRQETGTILDKTHMPYALNKARAVRWEKLFYKNSFTVKFLPDYNKSNPFVVFASIPAYVRYEFMLDSAQFFIDGFIKGPSCRGQVALSVIQDKFWVFFRDPKNLKSEAYGNFIYQQAENLDLPSDFSVHNYTTTSWLKFSKKEKAYIEAQKAALSNKEIAHKFLGTDTIWQGDENAGLTIFRNFDSGIVLNGLHGETPKTAWLINYPVFERIHYLLVAGFDIYGPVRHQLLSRLYMDFLRIESEMSFITLLPKSERKEEIKGWYRDSTKELHSYLNGHNFFFDQENTIVYQTDNHKKEILTSLRSRYYQSLPKQRADKNGASFVTVTKGELAQLQKLPNLAVQQLGQTSFIYVEDEQGNQQSFTLLRHNSYKNVSSLLFSESNHLPKLDSAELFHGYIGSYPQIIFNVKESQLAAFVQQFTAVVDDKTYKQLLDNYGVRRTNPDFWRYSDKVHQVHKKDDNIVYGLFDYNRLENR
ncbi:MAG: fatty acid cis/trans isomerase [Colwellia sp.]|nr:fatty acid cis/trans isomerase [Colwellia sp.]